MAAESADPRKAAVEAIARAKARKLAQSGTAEPQPTVAEEPVVTDAPVDPRKAAVEAAIARAKARKLAQSGTAEPQPTVAEEPVVPDAPVDPRKAAVEAAIARAKARKLAQTQAAVPQAANDDPRKAAVAAAIARVQAKRVRNKLSTRIKWFSESQVPPIPITSVRPRALCCWSRWRHLPGIAAQLWFFGWGTLLQIVLAIVSALGGRSAGADITQTARRSDSGRQLRPAYRASACHQYSVSCARGGWWCWVPCSQ